MISRHQFSAGSENIKSRQVSMPRIGVKGTKGTRNGRSAAGCVRRMMSTAAQTMTKAKSVPMLTTSSNTVMGKNAASVATKRPVTRVDFQGVRNFSCIAPKKEGGI